MSGVNHITVTGNLTRDPEVKFTPSGIPVCEMRIGISTRVKGGDDSIFVDVEAWEKQAESCGEHLRKGSWILVEGRLKQEQWESDGQRRSKISIVGHRIVFLDRKSEVK